MVDPSQEPLPTGFLAELRRRNVLRVALFYGAFSWLTLQVSDIILPALNAPAWAMSVVLLLLAIGFPIVLILAWVFELTPEGIKREHEVDRDKSISRDTARRIDFLVIGVLSAAVLLLLADKFLLRAAAPPERTIAVLPFMNVQGDEDGEVFSDGLAETLLHRLAQVRELQVAARTSSFQFKGEAGDVANIGKALGVRNLLEGSVRRQGDTIRVTAQLIDAQNGFHLWSGNYDRKLQDIFAIQDDIAAKVVDALQVTLLGEALAKTNAGMTSNYDAYAAYLRGRHFQAERTYRALLDAEQQYRDAIRIDPDYAQAYIALAETYLDMRDTGLLLAPEAVAKIDPLIESATSLVGKSADVLAVTGRVERFRSNPDFKVAERAFVAALNAQPDNVAALKNYAEFLVDDLGKPADGLRFAEHALRFDPRSESLLVVYGKALHDLGRDAEALEQFALIREINPNAPAGYSFPANIYVGKGDFVSALGAYLKTIEVDPEDHELPVVIGRLFLDMLDPEAARPWFEKSIAMAPDSPAAQAGMLDFYAASGAAQEGLALARKVLAEGAPRRFGARNVSMWWLLYHGVESGDGEGFLSWLYRLYPELAEEEPQIDDANSAEVELWIELCMSTGKGELGESLADSLIRFHDWKNYPDADLFSQVVVYGATGRNSAALNALSKMVEQKKLELLWAIDVDPALKGLRDTQGYKDLIAVARDELTRQRREVREIYSL